MIFEIVPIFATQQATAEGFPGGMLLVMGLMFAAMWFLLIAPQRKKQKELQKMITELKSGDEVMTAGGIFGTITNVKDDRFVIKVSDGAKIEVAKSYIQIRLNK